MEYVIGSMTPLLEITTAALRPAHLLKTFPTIGSARFAEPARISSKNLKTDQPQSVAHIIPSAIIAGGIFFMEVSNMMAKVIASDAGIAAHMPHPGKSAGMI